jgi:hypothetical protein
MSGPFTLKLTEFCQRAGVDANRAMRQVIFSFTAEVIDRSPVDTGRFRGNWRIATGSPDRGVYDTLDKTSPATADAAYAAIAPHAAFTATYLTNNLPYAWKLENGWSRRWAPVGMVKLVIPRFRHIVDGAAYSVANGGSIGVMGVQ